MIEKEEANEKVASGWIKVWIMFEAMAANIETAEEALRKHVEKFDLDSRASLYKKEEMDGKKVENPPIKGQTEAWSKIIEVELVVRTLSDLIELVIEYGPSATEILEPNEIKIKMNRAQDTLNLVSEMMHRFAAAGIGGILIPRAGSK